MNTTELDEQRSATRSRALSRPACSWFWRGTFVALVVAWVIFAHGCHSGDHDDELALPPEQRPTIAKE